jgi:hypothetical protein
VTKDEVFRSKVCGGLCLARNDPSGQKWSCSLVVFALCFVWFMLAERGKQMPRADGIACADSEDHTADESGEKDVYDAAFESKEGGVGGKARLGDRGGCYALSHSSCNPPVENSR